MKGSVRSWRSRLGDKRVKTVIQLNPIVLVCYNLPLMNITQLKCLSVFFIFAIIGFGPISPGCLIGMYVVVKRPEWFSALCKNLYVRSENLPSSFSVDTGKDSKNVRIKCFLCVLGLFIIDIAPVPVTPVVAYVIILSRPIWFYTLVENVYADKNSNAILD